MTKAMIFIDGTWFYSNTPRLAEIYGRSDYHVDFGKLPRVLATAVSQQNHGNPVDVVRTFLFGSYAANYDLRDEEAVQRRLDFFSLLKEEYHYEVEIFPINFRGRRIRKADRDPRDTFDPKEKCVDISLATAMLYYAAVPYAYDIAIVVLGDQDFKPVLQTVRRLGKRVAIASIRGSCAPEFAIPSDPARVKDFDVVWLDDCLNDLELKFEPQLRVCASPNHAGDRRVWTTFHPRKGQKYYCDACRAEFAQQKREAQEEMVSTNLDGEQPLNGASPGGNLTGEVVKKVADRGYGFIRASDGNDYFFHLTDLEDGLDFLEVHEGLTVSFEVKRQPGQEKAGAAQRVMRMYSSTIIPPDGPKY